MKKILIMANQNPFIYKGGVERVNFFICQELKKRFDTIIICIGNKKKNYSIGKIKIFQLKLSTFPPLSDFEFALKINILIGKIKPDLIIDNGAISFLANTKKYKIISICHGTNYGNYKSRKILSLRDFIAKIYRLFLAKIQEIYLKQCKITVAISKKIKKEIINYYHLPAQKIAVIENGTNIKIPYPKQIVNKPLTNSILFVSTDHKWKGIEIVEKLAKINPKINFYICGSKYQPKYKNIKYWGLLNQKELFTVMKKSDIFILPSIYEGQSLAILDALACGMPVVISAESDPAIIKNGENGFMIKNQNINDYDKKIHLLFSDKKLLKKIRTNNINLMKNYTWDIEAKKYLDLIEKII